MLGENVDGPETQPRSSTYEPRRSSCFTIGPKSRPSGLKAQGAGTGRMQQENTTRLRPKLGDPNIRELDRIVKSLGQLEGMRRAG